MLSMGCYNLKLEGLTGNFNICNAWRILEGIEEGILDTADGLDVFWIE